MWINVEEGTAEHGTPWNLDGRIRGHEGVQKEAKKNMEKRTGG